MFNETLVDLSRLQFAITAIFHFFFVPLTIGLGFILAIMETVYVMTGREIYKEMVRFWGKLFGINFAMGVTTGLTMEFQFGTNWAYLSHYVGDIFGAPLAIEALTAFFLESTLIGLFFFGWDRLSKLQHLSVTYLMGLGANSSALWILIANGWMQNPVGATFSPESMRMEVVDFWAMLFNPDAQAKFVHTVSASYVTGSLFVLGISAYYLLKGRDVAFARKSFRIAAAFGFASALSVIVLGDESGYAVTELQQTKLAAMEAIWDTEEPPAAFTLFAIPDEENRTNRYEVKIPYLMGIIGTRSLSTPILGMNDLVRINEQRVRSGAVAVAALARVRADPRDEAAKQRFQAHINDLGFGLLLLRYTEDVNQATPAMVRQAALDTIPKVWPMFWSFRVMVLLGFAFLVLFGFALYYSVRGNFAEKRWLLRWALWFIPMPWVASELGWFVAEYGRQPWTIYGFLPTHFSVSPISLGEIYLSLSAFILFYSVLFAIELHLMVKYARQGPGVLRAGRDSDELPSAPRTEA